MNWLIEIQRWLYGGMSDGIRATDDVAGLAALMGAAFFFGMVHALMPGHGKSVLVSYPRRRSPIPSFFGHRVPANLTSARCLA